MAADLSFSIIISNNDSKDLYSQNTPGSFISELPYIIHLPGLWSCVVEAIFITVKPLSSTPDCIHATLDFLRPSIIYGREERIGGTFSFEGPTLKKTQFALVPYGEKGCTVDKRSLARIKVEILDSGLKQCLFFRDDTVIMLRFNRES